MACGYCVAGCFFGLTWFVLDLLSVGFCVIGTYGFACGGVLFYFALMIYLLVGYFV